MVGLGWDEMAVLGVLGIMLFDEKRVGQAWRWFRETRAKLLNLRSDIEQKITDKVHQTFEIEPIAEQNAPVLNLRKQAKFRLENLDSDDIADRSQRLEHHLSTWLNHQKGSVLAAFLPLAKEPQITSFLAQWLLQGKTLLLPWVNPQNTTIHLCPITDLESQTQVGAFGILEPIPEMRERECPTPEIILVPGLVFGERGQRIGRGKGYYDRLLATYPDAIHCGLAFEVQLFNTYIPQNAHDVPMHTLITDVRTREFHDLRHPIRQSEETA